MGALLLMSPVAAQTAHGASGTLSPQSASVRADAILAQPTAREARLALLVDTGVCAATPAPVSLAPSVDSLEEPRPIEVLELGFTGIDGGSVSYAVVLRNPNAQLWHARAMEVSIGFFDVAGALVGSIDRFVTVVAGQTTASGGLAAVAGEATRMSVTVSDAPQGWSESAGVPGDVVLTDILTRHDRDGTRTEGRAGSTFPAALRDVQVVVVYRDLAGRPVGGLDAIIPLLEPGASVPWLAEGSFALQLARRHSVYWQLASLPSGSRGACGASPSLTAWCPTAT